MLRSLSVRLRGRSFFFLTCGINGLTMGAHRWDGSGARLSARFGLWDMAGSCSVIPQAVAITPWDQRGCLGHAGSCSTFSISADPNGFASSVGLSISPPAPVGSIPAPPRDRGDSIPWGCSCRKPLLVGWEGGTPLNPPLGSGFNPRRAALPWALD